MENEIIMNLSIVLDIVLGKRSFKITLRFLTFHQFGVRSWDPLPPIRKFELYLLKLRQKLNIDCNCFIAFTFASKTRATVQPTL